MKQTYILLVMGMSILSCGKPSSADADLEKRVTELEAELSEVRQHLAPGLAVLMNQNYDHLKKLGHAIDSSNWAYADFCMHEMEETFEQIEELHNNHDELVQPADVQFKAFIYPVFGELEKAVDGKNTEQSKKLFIDLKANCNTCHTANNHGFIAL